jgi:hypothetical protein
VSRAHARRECPAYTAARPTITAWQNSAPESGIQVHDEWFDPGAPGGAGPVRGVNVRMYDPDDGVWKMMWIASPTRQVQDLRAEVREGVLTMWQLYPERPGWKADSRSALPEAPPRHAQSARSCGEDPGRS